MSRHWLRRSPFSIVAIAPRGGEVAFRLVRFSLVQALVTRGVSRAEKASGLSRPTATKPRTKKDP